MGQLEIGLQGLRSFLHAVSAMEGVGKGWERDLGARRACSVPKAKDSRQWKPIKKWKPIKRRLVPAGSHGVGVPLWDFFEVAVPGLPLLQPATAFGQ